MGAIDEGLDPLSGGERGDRPHAHVVGRVGNERVWGLVGDELPPLDDGRRRDPYMEEGSHPDVVERVWDVLGAAVPPTCRAQANGTPVLAHPESGTIFALAHGTAYAVWLTPSDYEVATSVGLSSIMRWSGGRTTDLLDLAGQGWVWGSWNAAEADWVHAAYQAGGPRR